MRFESRKFFLGPVLFGLLALFPLFAGAQTREEKLAAADKLTDEASALIQQATPDSYRLARDKYTAAAKLFREIGDQEGIAGAMVGAGAVSSKLRERPAAYDYYNQALPALFALGQKSWTARVLNEMGLVQLAFDEQRRALDIFTQALQFAREAGDRGLEGMTLNNIGEMYAGRGDTQEALKAFERALAIFRAVGDRRNEAVTLGNVGKVYFKLGDVQRALGNFTQVLTLARAGGDRSIEAGALNNMGAAYHDLGEKLKGLELLKQALPLFHALGDTGREATVLSTMGATYDELDDKKNAFESYSQALTLFRSVNDKSGEAATLNNLGLYYFGLGKYQTAFDFFSNSLPLIRAVGDRTMEATTLNNIGKVYAAFRQPARANDFYAQALPLARAVGYKRGEAFTLDNLFFGWESTNNARFAVFFGKLSVNSYQVLRSNVAELDKNVQQTFLRSIEDTYRRLAEALIAQGRLVESQQVLNLFKDQQYFDLSSNKQAAPVALTSREAALAAALERQTQFVFSKVRALDDYKAALRLNSWNRGEAESGIPPTAAEASRIKDLEAELEAANQAYRTFINAAAKEFAAPPDDKDKSPEITDLRMMQDGLTQLSATSGRPSVAVYTLVGDVNYRALLVTADRIVAVSTPIKGDDLNQRASELWGLLRSDKYDTTVASKQLYDVVFKPLEAKLPKDTATIMWSLDGNLRYVPMAALWDGKQFLAERYNHVVFTRADKDRMTRAVRRVWTGTGFGSSQAATAVVLGEKVTFAALPGVTDELAAIFKGPKGGVIDGSVLPDKQFDRAGFLTALKQHRPLVHIASHFSFRPGDETRSFLLLGDGSAFTLEEMKKETNLFQGVELLTLSACNTAAQQTGANGREIDGFAELAQRLGAGAVMATLWPVSDASTPWLMRDFYASRQAAGGTNKAEALRRAQLALINGKADAKPFADGRRSDPIDLDGSAARAPLYVKDPARPFAHPYYWAPFVLIGNWR